MSVELKILPEIVELNIFYDLEEPILWEDLINTLKSQDFIEQGRVELPRVIEIPGIGALEKVTIARKGGCNVNYDAKNGILGVTGSDFKNVAKVFGELKEIAEEMGWLKEAKRCEFHTRCKIQLGKMPISSLKLISQAFQERYLPENKANKINEIFGVELQPFCIRLCPKSSEDFIGNLRTKPEWMDVYIFPYISNTKYLSAWIVFRDPNPDRVYEFANSAEHKIKEMIEVLVNGI